MTLDGDMIRYPRDTWGYKQRTFMWIPWHPGETTKRPLGISPTIGYIFSYSEKGESMNQLLDDIQEYGSYLTNDWMYQVTMVISK